MLLINLYLLAALLLFAFDFHIIAVLVDLLFFYFVHEGLTSLIFVR